MRLRKNLKRKIKTVVDDPSQVPMSLYFRIVSYDPKMLKPFLMLSRGMRKHLLFYVFESTKDIGAGFAKKYGQLFELQSRSLALAPISFCKEEGSKLDLVLKVRVKEQASKLENNSVVFGNRFNLQKINESLSESRVNDQFKTSY